MFIQSASQLLTLPGGLHRGCAIGSIGIHVAGVTRSRQEDSRCWDDQRTASRVPTGSILDAIPYSEGSER